MVKTFFFYDLETTGVRPRHDRIMQFAGQRTDMNLKPVGNSVDVLVRLNDDTLPTPEALMVTGITPQKTVEEGYSEAEFARMVSETIFTPDTIAVGFNNIRFDDEFMRALFWRNFYDPYEWSWRDGRSRWDILDVVRMTRALRSDGINWPVVDGVASNRLELLSSENGLDHAKAHDAMSDVNALIAVAQLIKDRQPQLFDYLLMMRDKNEIKKLVNLDDKKPFVYTSGRYDAEFQKTSVAYPLTAGKNGNVVVYDLRYDPTPLLNLSLDELSKKRFASWEERQAEGFVKLPVKELQYNRAPAVAPLGVLEQQNGWQCIALDKATIEKHLTALNDNPSFAENIRSLFERQGDYASEQEVEAKLYDGFVLDADRLRIDAVRNADERALADFHPEFIDDRLPELLLHYKARNYPKSLSEEETAQWESWRTARLQRQLPSFMKSLESLSAGEISESKQFVLQEMQLWAESILPAGD